MAIPEEAWKPGVRQDGAAEDDKDVAEITDLLARAGNWPAGLRWIARRVKPSRRHLKNLTARERKTGWKYSITCTNIPATGIAGVPGSHHPQYIDVVHRDHATVETDGVRTAKAMGLRNLPSKNLAGEQRVGARGEHRRRPDRLGPPPRPPRPGRPPRRGAGHAPLPALAHPRPPRPPRPQADPQDQPDWPWKPRSSRAGSGSAPCPHPAEQHGQSRQHGRRSTPARSEPAADPGNTGKTTPAGPRNQTDMKIKNRHQHKQ